MVSDTLEVTNYLRDRFDEQKIYLVGSSWGTILGVLAVQRAPELFHAYVGSLFVDEYSLIEQLRGNPARQWAAVARTDDRAE